MASLKYWLWLTTKKGFRPADMLRVVRQFGTPERAYFSDPQEYREMGFPPGKQLALADRAMDEAERILGVCERLGVHILTMQDAEYPERLRQIYDPPCVLYVKGRIPAVDELVTVAAVGPRNPSPYGIDLGRKLGMELGASGVLVVSGIAQGIDATVIESALRSGGMVLSVLGCGVDVCYPAQNAWLYEDVAVRGALISEYPPGTKAIGWHFPERNRIISGLSNGVAVVEGGLCSGALITARLALDQGRDVFVFPGAVHAETSAGTNRMLQQGEAQCILSARDILNEYELRFPGKLKPYVSGPYEPVPDAVSASAFLPRQGKKELAMEQKEVDKPPEQAYITLKECRDRLSSDELDILLALKGGAYHPDELTEQVQISARQVLAALTMLQVQGLVEEGANKTFSACVIVKDA